MATFNQSIAALHKAVKAAHKAAQKAYTEVDVRINDGEDELEEGLALLFNVNAVATMLDRLSHAAAGAPFLQDGFVVVEQITKTQHTLWEMAYEDEIAKLARYADTYMSRDGVTDELDAVDQAIDVEGDNRIVGEDDMLHVIEASEFGLAIADEELPVAADHKLDFLEYVTRAGLKVVQRDVLEAMGGEGDEDEDEDEY